MQAPEQFKKFFRRSDQNRDPKTDQKNNREKDFPKIKINENQNMPKDLYRDIQSKEIQGKEIQGKERQSIEKQSIERERDLLGQSFYNQNALGQNNLSPNIPFIQPRTQSQQKKTFNFVSSIKKFSTISIAFISAVILIASLYIACRAFDFNPIDKFLSFFVNPTPQNYQPFKPSGQFAAALDFLPQDRNLAEEKLKELQGIVSPAVDARRNYILAQISQRSGNLKEAFDLYSKINLTIIPYLADRVLLHKAEIAGELGDEKLVIDYCHRIINYFPHSLSVASAHYELGRSFLRQSNFAAAEREFAKVNSEFPGTQQSIGALYYLGKLAKDNTVKNSDWEKYLFESPNGRFSTDIIAAWTDANVDLSNSQKAAIGLSYYEKGNKEKAYSYLSANPSVFLFEKTWLPLAQIQIEKKLKVEANNTLLEGLKRFPNSAAYDEAIGLLIRNSSVAEFSSFVQTLTNSSSREKAAYLIWKLASISKDAEKKNLWVKIQEEYPETLLAERASSERFWEAYKSGQIETAKQIGLVHIKKYNTHRGTAKVRFWLAKQAEIEGDRSRAATLYQEILNSQPANYYTYRAQGRLKSLSGGIDPGWSLASGITLGNGSPSFQAEDFQTLRQSLNLASDKTWTWPLPLEEISRLHPTLQDLLILNLWQESQSLMPAHYEKDYPALHAWYLVRVQEKVTDAIRVASSQIEKRKMRIGEGLDYWLISYPFVFSEFSYRASVKQGFDPLLLQALMRQESRFQHRVVSSAKAIGLCQLMPGTAKEVAFSVGAPTPDFEMLCNPAYNIELGAKYLGDLIKQFGGQTQLAVAAYNAGPGSVNKWLKAKPNIDPDLFVETIPFKETQGYVINVLENYWIYGSLYDVVYSGQRPKVAIGPVSKSGTQSENSTLISSNSLNSSGANPNNNVGLNEIESGLTSVPLTI
jgi:soluble lytic murein transglycosylase